MPNIMQIRRGLLVPRSVSASAPSTGGSEATAFLARTTGLDATHTNAYIALIDGLVADGIWSKLDFLYILATQDSTTALLNLISTSYTATLISTPTFTVDRGFTGSFASTKLLNSNFNPSTAGSPKFVQNSAHVSAWSVVDIGTAGTGLIGYSAASGNEAAITPRYSDGNAYFRTNSHNGGTAGTAVATSQGFYLGNRTSSTAIQGYKDSSLILNNTSNNSVAVQNLPMTVVGINIGGSGTQGSDHQVASASAGSSLNSTDEGNYYSRLRTFMTVVGVP